MAAITGELHNSTLVPAVPEFGGVQPPAGRRIPGAGSRSSRSGPVSTKTAGGTVVTFPPQSAPGWSDPSTTIAYRDPLNQPLDDFRPVEIGPPAPSDASAGIDIGTAIDPGFDADAVAMVTADLPATTGSGADFDQALEPDFDNGVVDNGFVDNDVGFATETAPIPATGSPNEATGPPTLFPEQADSEFGFDESQRLFTSQTIDVAPDRLAIHFSEATGPVPPISASQPEGESQQPPLVMDLTDSLSDTGHIAEDHDGQPDRDELEESDQELDALLAELSAVSESTETVEDHDDEAKIDDSAVDSSPANESSPVDNSPHESSPVDSSQVGVAGSAPKITPPQPPQNFSALLKPPSVLSPQDTAVIYGLPGQPTDTPVAPQAEPRTGVLPRVGPRRVVSSKQPGQQSPQVPDKTPKKAPEKESAEVFGSETSVFPAIKTRRGDILEQEQAKQEQAKREQAKQEQAKREQAEREQVEGRWFTRSAELPYIKVDDSEPEVVQPRRRWLRYTFLVLLVLAIAAAAIIVALQPFGTLPFLNN